MVPLLYWHIFLRNNLLSGKFFFQPLHVSFFLLSELAFSEFLRTEDQIFRKKKDWNEALENSICTSISGS